MNIDIGGAGADFTADERLTVHRHLQERNAKLLGAVNGMGIPRYSKSPAS